MDSFLDSWFYMYWHLSMKAKKHNFRTRCFICKSSEGLHEVLDDYLCDYHYKDYLKYSNFKVYKTSTKTPEEIQKIKEKYKYGIPDGEIERWILEKDKKNMKQVGKMSILEHLACAMEDLNDESFLEDPEKAKLQLDKARAISELASQYTEVIKTDQEEKKIIIEAINVAGKWNYKPQDLPKELGFNKTQKNENETF